MNFACRGRWPQLRSGTLLACLVGLAFVLVDDPAVAGCSSHERPAISSSNGSGLDLGKPDRAEGLASADVAEVPRPPGPCTGAMCSGRPAMPVSPAPPPTLGIGLWAILGSATAMAPREGTRSRRAAGRTSPIRSSPMIFHPPRLSPPRLNS